MKSKWIILLSVLALTCSVIPARAQTLQIGPPAGASFPPAPQPVVPDGPPPRQDAPSTLPLRLTDPPPPRTLMPYDPALPRLMPYDPPPRSVETEQLRESDSVIPGWSFGGGIYIMRPYFDSNPAFTLVSSKSTIAFQQVNLSQQTDVAPLGWIGYTFAGGFGLRARWFEYDGTGHADAAADSSTDILSAGGVPLNSGGTVNAQSNLHVNVLDFEASYQVNRGPWTLLASGGVRYAHLSQWLNLNALDPTGVLVANATASHNFDGVGPTLAFEGRHRIGDTGFALYGSARASILFGSSVQNATASSNFTDFGVVTGSTNQACLMPIGEFELGAEWRHSIQRFSIFAQAGVMGQVWYGGGNAAEGSSLSSITGFFGSAQGQSSGNFGFLGGVLRLGVDF